MVPGLQPQLSQRFTNLQYVARCLEAALRVWALPVVAAASASPKATVMGNAHRKVSAGLISQSVLHFLLFLAVSDHELPLKEL